jgi:uncharacterized glyoxalase superfamily protein PhnB
MQTIYPYLLYDDTAGALDFLARALGFEETLRTEDGDRVAHGEMRLGEGRIMLGQPQKPVEGAATVYVYVEDVDAHFAQARAAGATIEHEPRDEPYGDRVYAARDPQGHSWYFGQKLDG